jgi:hypothetical protein
MFKALFDRLFNRPPTPDAFAQKIIQAAREGGYRSDLDYQADEFRVGYGDQCYFNLHNAYHEYQQAAPAQRPQVLTHYVNILLGTQDKAPQPFEEVRPLLRPVIRSLGMLEEVRLFQVRSKGWDSPLPLAHQPLGKDCVLLLAVDYPDATSTLTQGPQNDWGITLEQGLAMALDNLRDSTPEAFEEIIPGLYLGAWKDGYDASRALLPDVLQRAPIKGLPVFMMPTHDVLLVTGDKDLEGLQEMIELSFQAMDNGRALSSQVYTYDDRRIVPFNVAQTALQERLDDLQRMLWHSLYSVQKETLEKIHETFNDDLFVATHLLYQHTSDPNKTFSMATWTEGVDTSLPKADRVVLVRPNHQGAADTQVVAWHDVETHLGGLLAPDREHYPPRYRTLGFPSSEQLSRLTPMN